MALRSTILGCFLAALAFGQNPAITIAVDATANRRAISPNIYGMASADPAGLADLNCPVNRLGGNSTSRYNWQLNADNRGADWFFESIGDAREATGDRGDTFFSNSRAGGAQAMLTIPMIGWVAKLGANRTKLAGFSQAKYGAQIRNDGQWFADAGNGVLKNTGQNVTGNDPNDAGMPADSAYQQNWVRALVSKWGTAADGGVRYYILDNEPSLWHSTHRDVHPTGASMDEVRDKTLDYAAKIKAVDPSAMVVGPEEWGWSGYLLSGYDQQYGSVHGWSYLPDRDGHNNEDYLPWLLDQLRQSAVATGQRPLDVFSVHYYPQGGEFGDDVSTLTQVLRNHSTRSLWDPNYVDESWINDKVDLIPRLRNWVNTHYFSDAKIAITEYNWGAEAHINGATTQADILGIFGREGLDLATRWTTPNASTPTYKAIQMYRNYDGAKATFGDTSVLASAPNPDNVAAFAAQRSSDGALTIMAISKYLAGNTPVTFSLANFPESTVARVFQLTAANHIDRIADVGLTANGFSTTVPPQSITLFVIPPGNNNALNAPGKLTASVSHYTVTLHWSGQSSNETGFYIERAPIHTAKFARVGQVGANVTTFAQTLAAGMSIYRVQAFNSTTGQVSPYSNQVEVRVR